MAVKIKLKRIGKMHEPHYRIVVADARTKRGGRAIEEIGQYHPQEDPSRISVDSDRAQYWLGVGAQPTEAVAAILRVTGDWQAFRGEPAPPAKLMAEPKPDKKSIFEAAAQEAAGLNEKSATTAKTKRAASKKAVAALQEESPPAAEPASQADASPAPETAPSTEPTPTAGRADDASNDNSTDSPVTSTEG